MTKRARIRWKHSGVFGDGFQLAASIVTAWTRAFPGLKIETWGTQINGHDYKITRSGSFKALNCFGAEPQLMSICGVLFLISFPCRSLADFGKSQRTGEI